MSLLQKYFDKNYSDDRVDLTYENWVKNIELELKPIYKRSKSGKIQQWQIEVEGNKFRTIEGLVDGKLTISAWTICEGKNEGKKNETTPNEQAIFEALSKRTKKLESGYGITYEGVDESAKKISPMLAKDWNKYGNDILEDGNKIASQPKLDGIRCEGLEEGLFTRNGKRLVSTPHIEEAVKDWLLKLPKGTKIDGELYNHDLKEDFNKIMSLVRKTKPTEEDIKESSKVVQYHVYDLDIPNLSFRERFNLILETIPNYSELKVVETWFYDHDFETPIKEQIDIHYGQFLLKGYEGQMIRLSDSYYENTRTKSLLKRKEFKDEEFIIKDIIEGKGQRTGMLGSILYETKEGREFTSNLRGGEELYKEIWNNKFKYVGKKATVRFQNFTPDDLIPRFPVTIIIDPYDR